MFGNTLVATGFLWGKVLPWGEKDVHTPLTGATSLLQHSNRVRLSVDTGMILLLEGGCCFVDRRMITWVFYSDFQFMHGAMEICDALKKNGFWADFIDPITGKPVSIACPSETSF